MEKGPHSDYSRLHGAKELWGENHFPAGVAFVVVNESPPGLDPSGFPETKGLSGKLHGIGEVGLFLGPAQLVLHGAGLPPPPLQPIHHSKKPKPVRPHPKPALLPRLGVGPFVEVVALNQVVVGVRFPQDVLQIEAPGAVDHRVHLGEGQVFHGSPMAHALDLPRGRRALG